jgi:tetratricopeptide (TPR) repeat protein
MVYRKFFILIILVIFVSFSFAPLLRAQHREYYIYGKITDTENRPLSKVDILLRDKITSRGYKIRTNKKGEFKFAGLPHGIYEAAITKEGYMTKNDEWRLETPQDRIQKVEIPTIVLVSEELAREAERLKRAQDELKEALDKVKQRDFDAAIPLLKQFLESNPKDPSALYLLGLCYTQNQMYAEAVPLLEEVTALLPTFADAYQQLGICYQQLDDFDKALESYQKAIELESESVEALYNLGLILFRRDRVEEGLIHFERALIIKPDEPEFLEMAGRCYIHQGDFPKAIEYLEKAKSGYTDQDKIEFLDQLITKLKEEIE